MASEIPVPRSYQVILGDIIDTFRARFGIRRLKVGGPILTMFEAAAQSDLRSTQDIFNLLDLRDVNRLTGAALDFVALDEGLTRFPASPSSSTVDIFDTTIERIASKIYSGATAPVAGSFSIKVVNAEAFPSDGTVYIGRGTTNVEGPLTYTAKTSFGTYWELTLDAGTPTQRYHNLNEDVVVGQNGDRLIPTGSTCATKRDGRSQPIEFTTTVDATILDGETSVRNVAVVCRTPGTSGNVPRGAISVVSSSPFAGSTCANPLAVSNGLDIESDDKLRERLLLARASRSKGTIFAILSNTSSVFSAEESKRVISATIVTPASEPATVFIDDGTGYEERTVGVPFEVLMDSAAGGEQYFSLTGRRPISRAFAKTSLTAPFQLTAGAKLAVYVGGILSEHSFNGSDFTAVSSALAAEVVSSINSNPDILFSARTAENGSKVSIFARSETNEDIRVAQPNSGDDANDFLGFSTAVNYTAKLYKNDQLLYKDGREAIINTAAQSFWQTMGDGIQINIAVDGTPSVTYTFNDADFISANTGYTTVSKNNSIASWAAVFNAKVPGITASDGGGFLILTSNRGTKATASIVISEVDPVGPDGSLIQSGMFTESAGLEAFGINRDYTLNRNTAQIKLFTTLTEEDSLTVGSFFTRAYSQSIAHDGGSIAFNDVARLWLVVDGAAEIISTGIAGVTQFTTSNPGSVAGVTEYAMSPSVTNLPLEVGDWAVVWDASFVAHGAFRVNAIGSSLFDLRQPYVTNPPAVPLTNAGLVFVRADSPVQEIRIPSGTQNLDAIVDIINDQIVGATASVYRGRYIRLTSNSFQGGDIMVVTCDLEAQKLGFTTGVLRSSAEPHLASVQATTYETSVPEFTAIGRVLSATTSQTIPQLTTNLSSAFNYNGGRLFYGLSGYDNATYPAMTPMSDLHRNILDVSSPTSSLTLRQRQSLLVPTQFVIATGDLVRDGSGNVTVTTPTTHGFKVGDMVHIAPVSTPDGNFVAGIFAVTEVPSVATFVYVDAGSATSSTEDYGANLWEGPMAGDLFCLTNPYVVGPEDTLTVIMNDDPDTQAYSVPLFRRVALTGTPSSTLTITDSDNGGNKLSDSFGTEPFFDDFWVFMKPRIVSHLGVSNKDIMWRLNRMGSSGNAWTLKYVYPGEANHDMSFEITSGTVIEITLPSSDPRTGLSIFPSTRFTSSSVSSGGGYAVTISYSSPVVSAIDRTGSSVQVDTATAHGFAVGDTVYLSSTDGNYPSGSKVVATVIDSDSFTYNEAGSGTAGSGVFTITSAPSGAQPNFSSVVANDIVHIESPNGSFFASGNYRVTASTATSFTFFYPVGSAPPSMTTPQKLASATALSFYPIDTAVSTANDVIAFAGTDMAELLSAENYVGVGTGVISISTQEEGIVPTVNYNGTSVSAFTFRDGLNFVKTSDLGSNPNTILLKAAVGGAYSASWAGEEAHLVPATVETLVKFLNASAVTGLPQQANIEAINRDGRIQITAKNPGELGGVEVTETTVNGRTIEIIGVGDTNLLKVNISRAFEQSLEANSWVVLENSLKTPKTFLNITSGSQIALSGQTVTFNANVSTVTSVAPSNGVKVIIHKVGKFVVYMFPLGSAVSNLTGKFLEVRLKNASQANNFTPQPRRIIRSGEFTSSAFSPRWVYFWVENENAETEDVVFDTSGTTDLLRYWHEDSVLPGDEFEIAYALGASSNIGTFTVQTVTPNSGVFTVDKTFVTVGSTVIGSTNFNSLRLREPPTRLIKKISTIGLDPGSTINPSDPGTSWVIFDEGALLNRISETLGATVTALGRFQFDTTPFIGTNGYNVTTGLIGEVSKVLYGDLNAPSIYPGVVAAGASVNISGPNIKRIRVSLQVRLRTGATQQSVLDRVRNSVMTFINQSPLGVPVAIGRIVSAASGVPGVAAIAVLSPTYSSSSDVIPVQANEKPFIFDATSDINLVVVD